MPISPPQKIRPDLIPDLAITHKPKQLPRSRAKISTKSEKSKRKGEKKRKAGGIPAAKPGKPAAKPPALNRHPAAKAARQSLTEESRKQPGRAGEGSRAAGRRQQGSREKAAGQPDGGSVPRALLAAYRPVPSKVLQ